jgi:crossover junction endodeoxyribonuclease RusA
MIVTVSLPVPPSVNGAYRNVAGRGRVKSRSYKIWLRNADAIYLSQKREIKPVTGPCDLYIKIPASTRGDVSNRIKAVEDYLVSREITGDDRHNRKVTIERDESVTCCVVTITPADSRPVIGDSR